MFFKVLFRSCTPPPLAVKYLSILLGDSNGHIVSFSFSLRQFSSAILRIIFLRCLILFLRATEACQLAECLVKMPEAYKETSPYLFSPSKGIQNGARKKKKTICYVFVFPAQRQQETEKLTKTMLRVSFALCFVFSLLFCYFVILFSLGRLGLPNVIISVSIAILVRDT